MLVLQRLKSKRAFTLLELIVVIVILGVLAALAIPSFNQVTLKSKDQRSLAELQAVTRESVALNALSATPGETDLRAWLKEGPFTAADAGTYAGGNAQLKSIAWKSYPEPASLSDSILEDAMGAVSDEYGFFSFNILSDGIAGLAMRSLHPQHCVFLSLNLQSGTIQSSAIKDWSASGADACRGINASLEKEDAETLRAIEDTISVQAGGSIEVDLSANDLLPDPSGTSISDFTQPANGTLSINGFQATYTPNQNFQGTDLFTYTLSDNTGSSSADVNISVTPKPLSCAGVNLVPASWLPLDINQSTDCLAPAGPHIGTDSATTVAVASEAESFSTGALSLPVTPVDPSGFGTISALSSFPSSDNSQNHILFAATDLGEIFWLKDSGAQGVRLGGCSIEGQGSVGNCEAGQVLAAGQLTNVKAMVAGEAPTGTDPRSAFSYNALFIASDEGISVMTANALSAGAAPTLIPGSETLGNVNSMTGYACFDASGNRVAGDCLWVLSGSENSFSQFNINTGEIRTHLISNALGDPTFIQAISYNGIPQLLLGDSMASLQRYATTGLVAGGKATSLTYPLGPYTLDGNTLRLIMFDDYQSINPFPGGSDDINQVTSFVPDIEANRDDGTTVSATHWHGVSSDIYVASDDGCVRKIDSAWFSTLWCNTP